MLREIIPGQARAYDLWAAVAVGIAVWLVLSSEQSFVNVLIIGGLIPIGWAKVLAIVSSAIIPLGYFLGAHATHLNQFEHAGRTPTWIERDMKRHRWCYVILGPTIAWLATIMAMISFARLIIGG